eukprot:1150358-Pelagomonas_calceolata.AAC.3
MGMGVIEWCAWHQGAQKGRGGGCLSQGMGMGVIGWCAWHQGAQKGRGAGCKSSNQHGFGCGRV